MPQKNRDKRKRKGGGGYLTDPLTEKKARRQVRRVAALAVRPERRQIKAEQRASKLQQKRIKDYFPQYDQAIRDAESRSATASQQAVSQINQTSQASSDYAEALRQRLAAEGKTEAATRGAPPSPVADQTAQASNLARRTSADTIAGVTASQGAAQRAYLADKSRIGKREEIEQQLRESARGRSYNQDLRSLARDERDIRRDEFSRIRDSERDYALARRAARETTAGRRSDTRLTRRSQNIGVSEAAKDRQASKQEQRASTRSQLKVARAQNRNARRDDARGRRYLRQQGQQSGSGGKSDDSSRSVGPGAIKAYIADNATPEQVRKDPQVAIRQVKSRWPYLSRSYVARIVNSYASRDFEIGGR